ncbi:ABC transporter ATP-binding protein [Micromonospora echinospora]|uniref:ABC transporter ATP-binding protein n=1 Tax=Micromonospora echinospora TaxID=1877 RepID=UPI00379C073D
MATDRPRSPGVAASAPPADVDLGWWALVRMAPADTVANLVWLVLANGSMLLLPAVSAAAVDQVIAGQAVGGALAALVGLLALRMLAEAYGGLTRVSAATRVSVALRYRLVRHVFALGVPGARRHVTGDLVTRLTSNTTTAGAAVPALVTAAVAAAASLGGLVALWLIDWRLGVTFLVGALPAALLLRLLMNRATSSYAEYLERLAAIAARLTDALTGRRTIRASGTQRREMARVLAPLPELSRAGQETWAVQRAVSWQVDLLLTGVRLVVLAVAGLGVAAGRLSPGDVLAAAMYLTSALAFLSQVDTLIKLSDGRANTSRVAALLAERPQEPVADATPGQYRALAAGPGALSFRGVRVRLGDQLVLDGIDLDVPGGAAVALVGRSGAGKTTLALLAGRLLTPDSGTVLIDGVPTADLHPDALRREVSYAFDRPVLLGGTVREALTYGRPETSDEEVWRAARAAQAVGFIRRLPRALDTALADTPLSGGELQRLGLARAVAHGGRLLVLDDATSSLDTVTEAEVTRALTQVLAGRTRLIVAHRAGTAARADLVAWLDAGRIRAVAPHHALWEREAAYRSVFAADPPEEGDR